MLRKDLSDEIITSRINNFLREHPNSYDNDTVEWIQRNCLWGRRTSSTVSELDQLYNYLNLDQEDNNIYQAFVDYVTSNFDIDRPIYEIGGGKLPTVGKILALKQKQGTVTIYDPQLIMTKSDIPNLKLVRKDFTGDEIVESNALMVGYKPCDATLPMMNHIARNDLDFMVALCDCAHGFPDIFDEDDLNLWYQACEWPVYSKYAEEERTKEPGDKIKKVKTLSLEKYGNYCPVIYNSTEIKR